MADQQRKAASGVPGQPRNPPTPAEAVMAEQKIASGVNGGTDGRLAGIHGKASPKKLRCAIALHAIVGDITDVANGQLGIQK